MRILACSSLLLLSLGIAGCSLSGTAPGAPAGTATLTGTVHGGQQPVAGSHIYLYAANTAGYNAGAATYPSVSLLTATASTPPTTGATTLDANGNYYVTTDASGNFSITGDYSCTPDSGGVAGQQVYLYAVGGDPGAGTNAGVGLMAVLGDCPASGNFLATTPNVQMNEVTTVAAAYAMSGFAYDATHVSSTSTTLAKLDVENAFANAGNLASIATGNALTITPAGNGTVPTALLNTLADVLAACINSNGAITGPTSPTPCYTLFYNAKSGGSSGTLPADTATAAINIAHNPGANIATLYGSPTPTSPYTPTVSSQPNDFTLGITFTGGGIDGPGYLAVDGFGNVWIANTTYAVTELSPLGAPLSGAAGYYVKGPVGVSIDQSNNVWVSGGTFQTVYVLSNTTGAVLNSYAIGNRTTNYEPYYIAIDGDGNAWVSDSVYNTGTVFKLTAGSTAVSYFTGIAGLSDTIGIAVDGAAHTWIANNQGSSVSELTAAGAAITGTNGDTNGGIAYPRGVAVNSAGNIWIANTSAYTLTELAQDGTAIVSSASGGGLNSPYRVAIDGGSNVWVSNVAGGVSEFSGAGTAISTSAGYSFYEGSTGLVRTAYDLALDGSGDVWVANLTNNNVVELIGASVPVITPIAAGLTGRHTTDGSSSLGTIP